MVWRLKSLFPLHSHVLPQLLLERWAANLGPLNYPSPLWRGCLSHTAAMARVLVLMIACLLAASFPVRGRLILQAAPGPGEVAQGLCACACGRGRPSWPRRQGRQIGAADPLIDVRQGHRHSMILFLLAALLPLPHPIARCSPWEAGNCSSREP